MVKCVGYGVEGNAYYVQTCCAEAHLGQPCDCKTYARDIYLEKDAKFLAECISAKLNVPVENWCPPSGCGFSNDTIKKYLDFGGTICPSCGFPHLEGDSVEVETGSAFQKVTCLKCHTSWYDKYKLTGIELIGYDD